MENGSSDTLNPNFISPAGSSSTVNLHIVSGVPTPIEGNGLSAFTVTEDFDGQIRSTLSPVDIGVDAGIFVHQVMPVKWLSFDGKLTDKNSVILNWKTASEINNDYFEVERAMHCAPCTEHEWQVVGKVKGNGNTNSVNSYEFKDVSAPLDMTKVVYYRLKQVDMDGNVEYSNTITIALHEVQDAIIIAPNPFTTHFELLLPTNFNSDVITIDIKDIQGRNVFTQTYSVEKNQAKIAVETNTLNSGIYFMNFTTKDGASKYQKLLKQ
jgi:hypothetical protein